MLLYTTHVGRYNPTSPPPCSSVWWGCSWSRLTNHSCM